MRLRTSTNSWMPAGGYRRWFRVVDPMTSARHRFYTASAIARMLEGSIKRKNGSYQCKCPSHNDGVASLSVGTGRNGDTLINCQAGCDKRDVVRALGLEWKDLFREPSSNGDRSPYRPAAPQPALTRPAAIPPKARKPSHLEGVTHPTLGKPDTVYPYEDEQGELVYISARFSKPDKTFRQAQPDGEGGWRWSVAGIEPLPFHLPQLIETIAEERLVVVVEGEKDVLNLEAVGISATTNSGGAKKFPESAVKYFTDANIAVLGDNDPPGQEHAQMVAALLRPSARSVKIVTLPDLPEKGDVSDWLDDNHTADELLLRIESTDPWKEKLGPNAEGAVFVSLAQLMERPELLKPPPAVIPRLSHQGRTTLLVSPDKSGKTTLVAQAGAEASKRGQFLGEPIGANSGKVVWIGLEEALGDGVRRFHEFGAAPDNIMVVILQNPKLLEETRALLAVWPADLLILDSLTEYARVVRGTVPEDGDTSGWAGIIRPLVHLTREFPALSSILLHHPRRSDGQYRGSGEIAAAVDCLLEMRPPKENEDPTTRHLTGRARWYVPPFDVRFHNGRYELTGGQELSLDARVIIHVEQNPGVSISELRRLVGGRAGIVDRTVSELVSRGVILDLGKKGQHAYHSAATDQPMMGLDP
jgi:hypothetical protein